MGVDRVARCLADFCGALRLTNYWNSAVILQVAICLVGDFCSSVAHTTLKVLGTDKVFQQKLITGHKENVTREESVGILAHRRSTPLTMSISIMGCIYKGTYSLALVRMRFQHNHNETGQKGMPWSSSNVQ